MQGLWEEIQEARQWLSERWDGTPRVGLILGTGLGGLARRIQVQADFAYADIPHFPRSTAPSHAGRLLCGTLEGVPLMAMEGRFHYYEGYSLRQVTFPVRVMRAMGAGTLSGHPVGGPALASASAFLPLLGDLAATALGWACGLAA